MATVTFPTFPLSAAVHAANAASQRQNLFARFYNALMEARVRAAMREFARHAPHRWPETVKPLEIVPQDEVKRAGYSATFADAGLLPFVRGA
jgi:hypothetical protein